MLSTILRDNTTIRSRGLAASGCVGKSSTESGVQCMPSISVPSLMAIRCRLRTPPSIVAIYLQTEDRIEHRVYLQDQSSKNEKEKAAQILSRS